MKRSCEVLLIILCTVAAVTIGAVLGTALFNYQDQKAREAYLSPPVPTPTQALPQVMDVNVSVDGWSYNSHWGEMLYQYGRDISFWTSDGRHVYFATYFDFNANSAMRPEDRPGLLLEGGTWNQTRSEIIVHYSQSYDFHVIDELEAGNRSYESTRIFRCLDPDCKSLLDDGGITYTYEFNLTEEMARGGGWNLSAAVGGGGGESPYYESINNVTVGEGGTGG